MTDYSKRPLTKKQESAKEKAGRMIEYFKTVTLPAGPVPVTTGVVIEDVALLVKSQCSDLVNAEPLSTIFTNAYLRLYNLKQYIINESAANNSKP